MDEAAALTTARWELIPLVLLFGMGSTPYRMRSRRQSPSLAALGPWTHLLRTADSDPSPEPNIHARIVGVAVRL